ncbi:MAG: glycoside hydrolase family 30 protein [[Clostridium] leptum]
MNGKAVITLPKGGQFVTREISFTFSKDRGRENNAVNLYPEITYQSLDGFGGSATEAAGYVLSQLDDARREEALRAYFGRDGLRYSWLRVPVDSCDFSLSSYCAVTDPNDREFQTFSLKRDLQYIVPLLRQAQALSDTPLSLMLSPWSPPAFMKTNGSRRFGGRLREDCYSQWAKYLCRYIKEYQNLGFSVKLLSIQNEPKAKQPWDSCLYTAQEEKRFLQEALYPQLQKEGLGEISVCIWDHNKERCFERARDIIDAETDPMVGGVAFHWYSGDHFDALRLIRERYPDKKLVFTEGCVEYHSYVYQNDLANAQLYAHDIIGNLNAGMNLFLDWNLVLNQKGGPNHTGNYCDAPILCDVKGMKLKSSFPTPI